MNLKRFAAVTALSAVAILTVGARAHANYSYSTGVEITTPSGGGLTVTNGATGATATFGGTSITLLNTSHGPFFVPGSASLDTVDIALTSTTPLGPTGDSFSFNYTVNLTLNNLAPPGTNDSRTFPVSGTITVSNVNMGNGTVINVFNTPTAGTVVIGGVTYTGAIGQNPNGTNAFTPPTVNSPNNFGSIGGFVVATAVPEPSSIGIMGAGLLGVAGLGFARSRRAKLTA
jgi:hypothetical protein